MCLYMSLKELKMDNEATGEYLERLDNSSLCPVCKEELNDDDGVFFDKMADIKKCPYCHTTIEYVKQLKEDTGNPYCNYVWDKTYIKWEKKETIITNA